MVGDHISRRRKQLGLTQQCLAEQLGVSYHAVRQWEVGRRQISLVMLKKVASVLGTSSEQLLAGTGGATEAPRSPRGDTVYAPVELAAFRDEVLHLRTELNHALSLMKPVRSRRHPPP